MKERLQNAKVESTGTEPEEPEKYAAVASERALAVSANHNGEMNDVRCR